MYFKDYRFSEDLESTLLDNAISNEQIFEWFTEVFEYIKEEANIPLEIIDNNEHQDGGINFYISYIGPLGGMGANKKVKVDILRSEKLVFEPVQKPEDRAETDFVARRKAIKEKDFEKYETMFQKVHKEIKEGKRKIKSFKNVEQHLKEDQFYILDGIILYLEKANFDRNQENLGKNTLRRKDGRTRIVFENGTLSNMFYRSLSKSLYNNGKMITETNDSYNQELFVNTGLVKEEDLQTGWIYVLKSKSTNIEISSINDLYKIGYASTSVDDRIKNAKNEATYLFADVKKVAAYSCYNRNADKLESLLHRFFANACLDIEFENDNGQRINPREWFVVPFDIIEEVIQLILNENIMNYEYDTVNKRIKLKTEN